ATCISTPIRARASAWPRIWWCPASGPPWRAPGAVSARKRASGPTRTPPSGGRGCAESYLILMSQHVLYTVVHRRDEWHVIKDGSEPRGHFKSKADAVERGRTL